MTKEQLKEQGITWNALTREAGYSSSSIIRNYFNGIAKPLTRTRIEKAFDRLVSGEVKERGVPTERPVTWDTYLLVGMGLKRKQSVGEIAKELLRPVEVVQEIAEKLQKKAG